MTKKRSKKSKVIYKIIKEIFLFFLFFSLTYCGGIFLINKASSFEEDIEVQEVFSVGTCMGIALGIAGIGYGVWSNNRTGEQLDRIERNCTQHEPPESKGGGGGWLEMGRGSSMQCMYCTEHNPFKREKQEDCLPDCM